MQNKFEYPSEKLPTVKELFRTLNFFPLLHMRPTLLSELGGGQHIAKIIKSETSISPNNVARLHKKDGKFLGSHVLEFQSITFSRTW